MNRKKFFSDVIREACAFAPERPETIISFWEEAVQRFTPHDRESLLMRVVKEVEEHRAAPLCLVPFIEAEPVDATIITRASFHLAVLMEPSKSDLLAGPKLVQNLALATTRPPKAAAIYAGLLLMGDRRVSPLLHQCWRRLDRRGQKILSIADTEVVYASIVDFFLDWLEDVPEEGWGRATAALARLPSNARCPEVRDIERKLPANKNDGQPCSKVLDAWTFPEYGQRIGPRVRALMDREHEPKVLPLVAAVWGIIKEDDPILQRGSSLSYLPAFVRGLGNTAFQQEEEIAEQGETASLHCGANPYPGIDWRASIRLVEERPGYYTVWQTNARDKWIQRAQLCGSPPWRLLATYLASEEDIWCMNVEGPEEFGSSGFEPWQETALFVCWFRSNDGSVNHGVQFQWLSDAEVQRVCEPYDKQRDWRRSQGIKLWNDLSRLSSLIRENPAIDSTRLKDILDRLGCWNSPDPVHAAIECLESQAEALKPEACGSIECPDEVPNRPPGSRCIYFGSIGPQDTRFGINWNNITERLTLQNWSTKALVRKASSGWLYLWIKKGHYAGTGVTVYQIDTASEGGLSDERYERRFSNLERALAYANGDDNGNLAKETSPATSVRDYPPQQEQGWHILFEPLGMPGLKKSSPPIGQSEPHVPPAGLDSLKEPPLLYRSKWEGSYQFDFPLRPIGKTTTVEGDLVRKWCYDVIDQELEPIWPSQHHNVRMGEDGVERTIRIIYDPDTHSIITRTVADRNGDAAGNSLDLQRQAFLAVGRNDPTLRWMPDGGRYVQGKTEIAFIPPSDRDQLIRRDQALTPPTRL